MVLCRGDMRKIGTIAGIALSLGAASTAYAQSFARPTGTAASNDNHTDINAGFDVSHETNVAHTSLVAAAARGLVPLDDFVQPDISADVQRLIGENTFSLVGEANYSFHRRNKRLDRERIQITPTAKLNLGFCNTSLTSGYSRAQADLASLASSADKSLITNLESKISGGAEVSCGNDFGFRPMGGVSFEDLKNSATARKGFDRAAVTFSAGIAYVHPSVGTLMLYGSRRKTRFAHSFLPSGGHNGYDVNAISGRFSRDIGSRMRGWVEVSYVKLQPLVSTDRNISGLNWNTNLDVDVSSRLQAHASLGREVNFAIVADAPYHTDTTYGATLKYAFSERLQLVLDGSLASRDFGNTRAIGGVPLTNDKLYNGTATLNFHKSERLKFSLSAGYDQRAANTSYYNYHSFSVQTGVRLKL